MLNNYSYQMLLDYLKKEIYYTGEYHDQYQKLEEVIVQNVDKEKLNNPANKEVIKFLIDIMRNRIISENFEFTHTLNLANEYLRAIKTNDGSYNIYPTVNTPTYTDMIIDYCLTKSISIKDATKYYSELLKTVVEEKREELNNSKINEYRGNLYFVIVRSKAIYDAIKSMSLRTDLTSDELTLVRQALDNVTTNLNQILNIVDKSLTIDSINTSGSQFNSPLLNYRLETNEYDKVYELYDQIIAHESTLIDISQKIWTNYAKTNGVCLIHKLTSGIIPSDDMSKICTTYYSNSIKKIVSYRGNTGYIYPIDLELILSICNSDAGSWECGKQTFIYRGLPNSWQLNSSEIWYENPYQSKLFSPEFMDEQLLNDHFFGEIVINNKNRKIRPISCFYTDAATDEEIAKITKVANMQGLEVKLLETAEKKKVAS